MDGLTWEDVPDNGAAARYRGFDLGDCPYEHGDAWGNLWRKMWIEADLMIDFQTGDRARREDEVQASVRHLARTPEQRAADELIDSFNEEPEPEPDPLPFQGLGGVLVVPGNGRDADTFRISVTFSIDWEPDPAAPAWKRPEPRPDPEPLRIPRSATRLAMNVQWASSYGPAGIVTRDSLRQLLIEEQAKLALRDRSKTRITDLTA